MYMSSPDTTGDTDPRSSGRETGGLSDVFEHGADSLDDTSLQQVIGQVLRSYVRRREDGHPIAPFVGEYLTATEVVVVATELLEAAGLDLVDLSIWRGLGSKPPTGDEVND